MQYDPAKTSERRVYDTNQEEFLQTGAWIVIAKQENGQWFQFWPDGIKPDGAFLEKAVAVEWMNGAIEYAQGRGLGGEVALVEIKEVQRVQIARKK